MFAVVPNPNADPVIVCLIMLVALVVVGSVLWMSFAERDSSGRRRLPRFRRKQKSGLLTAAKSGSRLSAQPQAKINSSAFLGERFKPKSGFNIWMESDGTGKPSQEQQQKEKEKQNKGPDWLSGAA